MLFKAPKVLRVPRALKALRDLSRQRWRSVIVATRDTAELRARSIIGDTAADARSTTETADPPALNAICVKMDAMEGL